MGGDSKDILPFDGPGPADTPTGEAAAPDQTPPPLPPHTEHPGRQEEKKERGIAEYERLVLPGISLCSLEKESPLSVNTRITLEASGIYFKYQYNGNIFLCTSKESGRGHTPSSYIVSKEILKQLNESAQRILDRIRSNQYHPTWHDDY